MPAFTAALIGNDTLLIQCAEVLRARGNAIAVVVTEDAAIVRWAEGAGLRVETPGPDLAQRLRGVDFDWLLSIANLWIVPEEVLALARSGAVNFHDGPLPRHAGLNAPVWALIEGDREFGITWHLIEPGIDTGDILVSRRFAIEPDDTALTMNTRAFEAAIESFPDLLTQLETGRLRRRRQDPAQRSYHAGDDRPAGHGLLDFSRPADTLERLVRALDHGPYWNPLCLPKLRHRGRVLLVGAARAIAGAAAPGTVLDVTEDALTVACETGAVALSGLRGTDGAPVAPAEVAAIGDVLDQPDTETLVALRDAKRRIAPAIGFWRRRLAETVPLTLPADDSGAGAPFVEDLPDGPVLAVLAVWAARIAGRDHASIAYRSDEIAALSEGGFVAPWVPVPVPTGETVSAIGTAMAAAVDTVREKTGFAVDLPLRDPGLLPPAMPAVALSDGQGAVAGAAFTLELTARGGRMHVDPAHVDPEFARLLLNRFRAMLAAASAGTSAVADLPRMDRDERAAVLTRWNDTAQPLDGPATMAAAFEAQADATPDRVALVFEAETLSYAELDARANRAAHLLRAMGVRPGQVVGLCCARSADMVVSALAILKAGGAYLPMDPAYPAERLGHFVADSATPVIVTQAGIEDVLPPHAAQVLVIDAEPRLSEMPTDRPAPAAGPDDLAYLIYTSGSTGTPKGVMVEHRNVMNFYAAMDAVIPHEDGGRWLAVTSLSFDISVLELFWTTARGFTVVLAGDADRLEPARGGWRGGGMDLSLFYWGNDDGEGRDKYRLLLDGARFADEHGLAAVWTPERHFHAFGGPYPNPSVTGAAVAAVTSRIGVRGGSVVAPLHHPARIAEEWAVIDNLTNGRAGIAIASGWQPDDFVLRPENTPPANKPALEAGIDAVRRLWRGERVGFPRADGTTHEIVTQPRPVSRELPMWLTTAGNPDTWRQAGALGCHVLTHLLGQSIAEVGEKIAIYHAALRAAGHDPADFQVALMLHTFLADSRETARETARGPMRDYLRAAAGLIRQYAWAFPAFRRPEGVDNPFDLQLSSLDPDELEAILDFAFERYFEDSGLFGTVDDALARASELRAIGVTEIACLIDYGIPRDTVLEGLRPLARVAGALARDAQPADDDHSLAALIVRHGVTHLQCTPTMARMIAADEAAGRVLGGLRHIFLGGEPLPGAFVAELRGLTGATLTNLYGPTETTIWSSSATPETGAGVVSLGHPVANTVFYVLDETREPVPVGAEGELWIGGDGVTRGYWNRADLTAERFVDNPFHAGRMYRTGDLVRRRASGRIDFVGRVDTQVKLRGFRIELGEIESDLEAMDSVRQAVVIARAGAGGEDGLVAYYTGTRQPEAALRRALARKLPAFMVPGRFVHLDAFPVTPNSKVDRKALPPPGPVSDRSAPRRPAAPPPDGQSPDGLLLTPRVAEIWARVLGIDSAAPRDNFFDLGGHSLLAVQVHRALREELGADALTITDIFRFPVLGDLATRIATLLGHGDPPLRPEAAGTAEGDRDPDGYGTATTARANAMARRRAMRARRSR